jgi:capsular polysaccharide transport system permease protein
VTLLRGLALQAEVVHALILRETRTRFGAHQLGYLWALLEPAIVILTFYAMFRVVGRPAPEGMDLFDFIATGIIPYTLFANTVTRVGEAVNGNKALLFYPQVRPLDLVIARSLLEAATFGAVFMALLGIHALWRQELAIDSPLLVILGLALASLLGTALGLLFCGLAQVSNVAERARGPLLRPLFWMSGIFFTAELLPEHVRAILLYNPVLHTTELVRAGWFDSYAGEHVDLGYVVAWILALGAAGLLLERAVRRRIELS